MVVRVNEQRDHAVIESFMKGDITRKEASIALDMTERTVTNRANKIPHVSGIRRILYLRVA